MIIEKKIHGLLSYCLIPDTIDSLVILCHGYGSNGMDLISLAQEWAPHCPNTAFVSPDAPYPCEIGGGGFQWFSLNNYSRPVMKDLINKEWVILSEYIDAALKEYNLGPERLILSGFSQGCMMALHTGFSKNQTCTGILGYSGMLVDPDVIANTPHKDMPICLIHGIEDSVVPVAAWDEAMSLLKSKGLTVSGHKSPGLPHGIDGNGLRTGLEFLQANL